MNRRRIIVDVPPDMRHERASHLSRQCHATITLDRATYRCGRDHVDGIHDAFTKHGDGGEVRW